MRAAPACKPDQDDEGPGADTLVTPVPPPMASESGERLVVRPPWPPAEDRFLPVACAVLTELARQVSDEVRSAMVIINVRRRGQKTFTIEVVALDPAGALRSIEASRELLAATSRMISDDERDGNGTWRRVAATLTPEARGDWVRFLVS